MNTNITLETLAKELPGKLWEKDGIRRVYVDRGYNTKKMTTKTYVYQKEDGTFDVSVYITCASQPMAWIKKEQESVRTNLLEEIQAIIDEQA